MIPAELAKVTITDRARAELAELWQQAEQEIAGERSARYATRREVAGAFATQPLPAARETVGGQSRWGPGSRTVTIDLAGHPRLHRVSRAVPVPPPAPLGAISARLVDAIPCPPPPVFDPRQYGPYFRAVGAATGTSTEYETDAAWRLALEAGTGATA